MLGQFALPFAIAATPAADWQPGPVLLWSALTLLIYWACRRAYLRLRWPLLHPGFTTILSIAVIVECTGRHYAEYQISTGWINWLLGPAVVAMAVPIYQLRATIRANAAVLATVIPLALGVAVASTTICLAIAGRPRPILAAGALKSITSPVAYRLAVDAGVPTDAAMAGVLIAGMLGATVGPIVLGWMRVRDQRAVGLALGCASHGIGVARAMDLGAESGAYASIAMSGTAMLGAVVVPFVLRWLLDAGGLTPE